VVRSPFSGHDSESNLAKQILANGHALDSLPRPTHDAAWWEAKTRGFDFSVEDGIDSEKFNRILWEGLIGGQTLPNDPLRH